MKRYDPSNKHEDGMAPATDGEWVRYSDHVEAMKQVAGHIKPVAWLVKSKRGMIRCAWTDEPSVAQLAIAEADGDTVTPLYSAPPAAPVAQGMTVLQALEANQVAEWLDEDGGNPRAADVVRHLLSVAQADPSAQSAPLDKGIEFWKRMVSALAGIIQDAAPLVGKEPGEESAEEIGRLLKQRADATEPLQGTQEPVPEFVVNGDLEAALWRWENGHAFDSHGKESDYRMALYNWRTAVDEESSECPECHGVGRVEVTHEPLRDGYTETIRECCDDCQGTGKIGATAPIASPVYDTAVVKRIATQMGWTPPGASPAALTDAKTLALGAMVDAMRWWSAQEDGIPAECRKAFDSAMLALGWSYSHPQDLRLLAASPAVLAEGELRAEFERQHQGRNLKQHRLRGTYVSAPIAALWNQHKRTANWMQSRAMPAAAVAASPAGPVKLDADLLATIREAAENRAEGAITQDGRAVFINYGDSEQQMLDSAAVSCLCCHGSGHRGDATAAAHDVLAERRRQVTAEGWTLEHDDWYGCGELASAAAAYALSGAGWDKGSVIDYWPWELTAFKAEFGRRSLIKAAALLLAEIERIDRAAIAEKEPK